MGLQTSASVEIARPATEVFRWLVEPEKLTAWAGGAGALPDDPSVLAVGFEHTGPMPGVQGGEATLRVDAWEPPALFTMTTTYPGGSSTTTYELAESGGATTLTCSSDTDWGKPDLSQLEAQFAGQSPEAVAAMRQAIATMDAQIASGGHDASTRAHMQAALDESLARLKGLVEAS